VAGAAILNNMAAKGDLFVAASGLVGHRETSHVPNEW